MIVLVRHGESTWNAERRLQGQLDPPLSEAGRAQVRALAPVIARFAFAEVVCSDLARARETAEVLGVAVDRYDPAWREIDVGSWAGRTAEEVDAEGDGLTNWRGGPRTAPDGETWTAFGARVAAALPPLLRDGGDRLVVCHGGCVRAACAHVTGGDPVAFGSPPNASVTVLEAGSPPRLLAYGITPAGVLATGLY